MLKGTNVGNRVRDWDVAHFLFVCLQAQHNTRMLATYAALDPRVQYLGYTIKVFAKVTGENCVSVCVVFTSVKF